MIEFDHIGIALKNVNDFGKVFKELFEIEFTDTLKVDNQKVNVAFSKADAKIELIEAIGDKSPYFPILEHPVLSFIKNKGEGLHHLCFNVDDIEEYVLKLKEKNIKFIGEGIMIGSYGHKVCFINPSHTNGILIELVQK